MADFFENIQKKVKSEVLFFAFAIIALIVFLMNTLTIFLNKPITTTFSYASVIVGIALIFESKIRQVLSSRTKGVDTWNVAKVLTFGVGLVVLVGGLTTVPFLHIQLSQFILGMFGYANILAVIVVIYELFFID